MIASDILAAVEPVVTLFERLGIDYAVVGSVASSAYGIARTTIAIDLVATPRSMPWGVPRCSTSSTSRRC
jgi:hypothetical protein